MDLHSGIATDPDDVARAGANKCWASMWGSFFRVESATEQTSFVLALII